MGSLVWLVSLAWLAAIGCTADQGAQPPPGRRFDAVLVDPAKVTPPDSFCESWSSAEEAKPFAAPALAGQTWSEPTSWRWVNVWATWCAPCVAEMPRLVSWRDQLAKEGAPVELVFLSVDADQVTLDRFYSKQSDFPKTVRIADPAALPEWLGSVGLDAGAPIPIHLFVDAENRTRCVRTGAISEADYAAVKRVIGG